MLVAPNDKVKEARQVAFTYAILCVLGVGHSVLVQHKDVKPLCIWYLLTCSWSDPAELHSAQTTLILQILNWHGHNFALSKHGSAGVRKHSSATQVLDPTSHRALCQGIVSFLGQFFRNVKRARANMGYPKKHKGSPC